MDDGNTFYDFESQTHYRALKNGAGKDFVKYLFCKNRALPYTYALPTFKSHVYTLSEEPMLKKKVHVARSKKKRTWCLRGLRTPGIQTVAIPTVLIPYRSWYRIESRDHALLSWREVQWWKRDRGEKSSFKHEVVYDSLQVMYLLVENNGDSKRSQL